MRNFLLALRITHYALLYGHSRTGSIYQDGGVAALRESEPRVQPEPVSAYAHHPTIGGRDEAIAFSSR